MGNLVIFITTNNKTSTMATRAMISFLDGRMLTTTYNHYDGYPDNLGKALDNHYEEPNEAMKIASTGYISYVDPETGNIDSKYDEPADEIILKGDFEDSMLEIAEAADAMGADYVYVYNPENMEWVNASLSGGTRKASEQLAMGLNALKGDFIPDMNDLPAAPDQYTEGYDKKWQTFISESKAIDDQWSVYVKSLVNDIRLNGVDQYADFSEADFIEDFENYIQDKTDV